ncbi:MAG: methylmalonyl-CoA epimerase [Planctomycetes bacterium]|nr:methylmalonyl-CoA epimerase [Planctomycetota bacterium]
MTSYPQAIMSRVLGVDHIAVVVEDLDDALLIWRDQLGLEVGPREVIEDQQVVVQMMQAGATRIELVQPLTSESPVQKFLEKRGPGLHHLALAVEDCSAVMEHIEGNGGNLIDQEPKPGAHGTTIAFVHPRSTGGVLTEIVEGGTL